MFNVSVLLLCWFNDKLTIDKQNKSTYVDKIVKPMLVRKSITRHELVEKIHHIARNNPNDYQIHVICKWFVAHEHYQTVKISDDDDIHVILELYRVTNIIELYVKKDFVSHLLPEGYGEFSRMLDLDNESTSFMSSVQHIPHVNESQIFSAYNT